MNFSTRFYFLLYPIGYILYSRYNIIPDRVHLYKMVFFLYPKGCNLKNIRIFAKNLGDENLW